MGLFRNWFKLIGLSKPETPSTVKTEEVSAPPDAETTAEEQVVAEAAVTEAKTILPKSVRPVSLSTGPSKAPSKGPSEVKSPVAVAKAPSAPAAQMVKKEISFVLGDFAERIPPGVLKPGRLDLQQKITFQSADLFSDLSKGRASFPLSKLAEMCPDLFIDPASLNSQDTAIGLPLQKLVEQIGNLQTRQDQVGHEENTHIFETPFLQGALADGNTGPIPSATPTGQKSTPSMPTAVVADSPAAGTPAADKKPNSPPPIIAPGLRPPPITARIPLSGGGTPHVASPSSVSANKGVNQRTIPMPGDAKSPINKEVPANVPATPTTPTPPARPASASGVKLPSSLPRVDETAPVAPKPEKANPALAGNVTLNLASILKSVPAYQIEGNVDSVDAAAMIDLPIALVQPQIRTGKVHIPVSTFIGAMPEKYRSLVNASDPASFIPLPLRDVISVLPPSVLQYRDDQVHETLGDEIRTPFSDRAKEDAKLEGDKGSKTEVQAAAPKPEVPAPQAKAVTPPPASIPPAEAVKPKAPPQEEVKAPEPVLKKPEVTRPVVRVVDPKPVKPVEKVEAAKTEPVKPVEVEKAPATPEPVVAAATPQTDDDEVDNTTSAKPAKGGAALTRSGNLVSSALIQQMFMTEETLDARKIAKLAAALPGISGTVICTADGLRLASAGSEKEMDSLSAIAPHFYQRVGGFVEDLKLGNLSSFTVDTENGFLSLFLSGTVCLVVLHGKRELMPGVRDRFRTICNELNSMYGDN